MLYRKSLAFDYRITRMREGFDKKLRIFFSSCGRTWHQTTGTQSEQILFTAHTSCQQTEIQSNIDSGFVKSFKYFNNS